MLSKKSDSSDSCWLSEFWLSLTKQDKVKMTVQGKAVVSNTKFMIFKVFDMYTESWMHNPADILSTFSLHVPSLLSSHLFSHWLSHNPHINPFQMQTPKKVWGIFWYFDSLLLSYRHRSGWSHRGGRWRKPSGSCPPRTRPPGTRSSPPSSGRTRSCSPAPSLWTTGLHPPERETSTVYKLDLASNFIQTAVMFLRHQAQKQCPRLQVTE